MANKKRRSARLARAKRSSSQTPSATPMREALNKQDNLFTNTKTDNMQHEGPSEAVIPDTDDRQQDSSLLPSVTLRTPKRKTSIQPDSEELHPHHHQSTTSKPLEEARWLGFRKMEPRTEPSQKRSGMVTLGDTPTKVNASSSSKLPVSPGFKFTFRRQSLELSPAAKKVMAESREEAARIRAQMTAPVTENQDSTTTRKIARPKGRTGRFSAAHTQQFDKMDSIANHPSAFRADPHRHKPATTSLKRTRSKADLDKLEEMPQGATGASDIRSPGHTTFDEPTQRVKRRREHDATVKQPATYRSQLGMYSEPSKRRFMEATRGPSSILRPLPSVMTPTKASLARTQNAVDTKSTLIPSLTRSKSSKILRHIPEMNVGKHDDQTPSTPSHSNIETPSSIKSILKNPHRLYSNDPAKIAAGTHVATPRNPRIGSLGTKIPATAPLRKHVDFTTSTIERDERGKSAASLTRDSTFADGSPTHSPRAVSNPAICNKGLEDPQKGSKRARYSSVPATFSFTFRSHAPIKFESRPAGTIRFVDTADNPSNTKTPAQSSTTKRKFDDVDSVDDGKENDAHTESRSAKRIKPSAAEPTKPSPSKVPASRLPQRKQGGGGSLSRTRLNLLATPKRRVG